MYMDNPFYSISLERNLGGYNIGQVAIAARDAKRATKLSLTLLCRAVTLLRNTPSTPNTLQ